ncbi:MAG: SHOCT domain-containing protein [Acidimicrobiia bacterium]
MMGFWAVVWLLFAALLVVGIVVLVRALGERGGSSSGSATSALQILEERGARGEIDRDEFEERRRTLQS